ncbi:hypothetical protein ACVW1B_003350 [Bradyrhizobium sp. USDA 4502]
MPRRAAKVTQADITRAIRAARATGASAIAIDGDGTIQIVLAPVAIQIHDAAETWTPSEALQRYLKRTESG